MSYINTELNEKNLFIIGVKVAKCDSDEQYQDGTANLTLERASTKRALIDTGANITAISREIADELGLGSTYTMKVITAGVPHISNLYVVDLAIADVKRTKFTPKNEKDGIYRQILVSSMLKIDEDRGYDIVLGTDILSQMHIAMFRDNIILSF